jgi:hypothetical protein
LSFQLPAVGIKWKHPGTDIPPDYDRRVERSVGDLSGLLKFGHQFLRRLKEFLIAQIHHTIELEIKVVDPV